MPYTAVTTEIRGQMILLGTGTSVGVPMLGCGCATCTNPHPHNQRTRCGAVLGLPEGNVLIDTPPDLRTQLLREKIGVAEAVMYTHEHADHLFGLDDLRLFPFYVGHAIPLYCEPQVEARIRTSYDYAFASVRQTHQGAVPQLKFRTIATEPFDLLGARVLPVSLEHGPRFRVLGFRIGNVAYCTDVSAIPPESLARLQGLDVLVLGALRDRPHPTHLSLDEAVAVARQLQPRQTYFTHISHDLEHAATNARLPPEMQLAHDGLRIPLT